MTEADMIGQRADEHTKQWPTLMEALGCVDCDRLFRYGGECPFCGSEAVMNIAALLTERQ